MKYTYQSIRALLVVALWTTATMPLAWAASSCGAVVANTVTCTQNTAITTVAVTAGVPVQGSVYPSIITTPAALGGAVTKVTVTLNGLKHTAGNVEELQLLLVSPSGKGLLFMGGMGAFVGVINNGITAINVVFDDAGTVPATSCDFSTPLVSGTTYKPRVCDISVPSAAGGFPANGNWAGCTGTNTTTTCPIAAPAGALTLATAFAPETTPSGDWRLFVRDFSSIAGAGGTIASWGLTITTSGVATAATTTSISTVNPNTILRTTPGASDSTAITVAVTSASAVNGGTVSFTDNGSALPCAGGNPTVSAGAATCNATFASEGVHNIQATYSGTAGFAPSSTTGNTFVMVNDRSTFSGVSPTGGQFCNNSSIALPSAGTPRVFPSNMYVTADGSPTGGNAFAGVITGLTVSLKQFSHTFGTLASMLLVSPSGKPYMMMANAFQGTSFGPVDLTLSDAGAAFIPSGSAATTGTFKPADYNAGTAQDPASYVNRNSAAQFNPLPAPTTGYFFPGGNGLGSATFGTTFGGDSPNGNWRLYAINSVDGGQTGSVGSWCLNFTVNASAVATTTVVSANPVQVFTTAPTQATVITATVSSTSSPTGTVTFTDNGAALCSNVPVSSGIATCNVPSFSTQGNHNITAAYTPTGSFGPSSGVGVVRVDARAVKTVVNATTYQYCNPGTITFPGLNNQAGPSSPYPANIIIPDLPGTINTTSVIYNNFTVNNGSAARDFTSMLVGPAGNNASTLDLMSRVGGAAQLFSGTITLADSAAALLPTTTFGTGSYKPTSLGGANTYPALTPPGPFAPPSGPFQYAASNGAATLGSVFGSGAGNTQTGNGTWRLYSQTVGNGTTGSIGSACLQFVVNPPVLAITKTHAVAAGYRQGSTGNTYTVVVSNSGPGPTGGTATVVDDTSLAPGLTITAMSGSNWTCTVGTKTCTSTDVVAALGAYPPITVTFSVNNNATVGTNSQTNKATIAGGGSTSTITASDPTTIIAAPVLAVAKSHTGNFTQGQAGVWNINVSNTAAASGVTSGTVTVNDTLPTGYTLASFSGAGWSCTGTGTANVSCTNATAVAGGASFATLALTVNVPPNSPTSVSNSATASGGGMLVASVASNADGVTVIQAQSITFTQPLDTALSAGPVALTATATSGLTVSFGSNSGAICTVAGASVTLVSAGVCSITATQTGNVSFAAAAPVTRTFNVLKATQTLSFPTQVPSSRSFVANSTFAINPLATSATPNSGNAIVYSSLSPGVCTVSVTTVTMLSTGGCVLAANQAGDANYNAAAQVPQSVAIGVASQSISNFVATPTNPVFSVGGTFTVSATGGASGNPVTFTVAPASAGVCSAGGGNGATITMLALGTCAVLADQAGNANYAAATQATLSIALGKTTQTITFPAITAFSWYQGSASLAATASSGLTVTYAVSSGPCSLTGNVLTASSPGSCVVDANQSGNSSFAAAAQQSQTATVNVGPALLDIDASGAPTKYDAATDGVMVMRFLLGYQGNAITNIANPGRTQAQILTHLVSILPLLDVDGDGNASASSDGLLILRYMLNLRGSALLAGASIGPATAAQVETAIGRLMPP